MGELLNNLSIQVGHENIIGIIQGPDIFITIFSSIRYWWAFVASQVSRSINDMLTIFGEERTGSSSFASTDQFIGKLLSWFSRHLAHKYLVAIQSFFGLCTLKH